MGQKVHPIGFRIGITENWRSRWYATKKDFGRLLFEDQMIRKFIKKEYGFAGISRVEVERNAEQVKIIIFSSRPGVLIGKKGAKIEKLKKDLEGMTQKRVSIDTREIAKADLEAQLVAESIAEQLSRRSAFRRTMKKAMETTMGEGALGIKVQVSGRLGGAEMARTEHAALGSIPLQTIRANIDYGFSEARTTYGHIGVKVWIYNGLHPLKEKK